MELIHVQTDDFCQKFLHNINESRHLKQLCDVTIEVQDASIPAHGVILASGSPFFMRRLTNSSCPKSIYLRGFDSSLVEGIIDFMYKGEIHVPQDKFKDFIQAAIELEILGLMDIDPNVVVAPEESMDGQTVKRIKTEIIKQEPTQDSASASSNIELQNVQEEPATEEAEEQEESLGLAPMTDGRVACLRCSKVMTTMGSARRHFKNQHTIDKSVKSIKCKLCPEKFAVAEYMKRHMSQKHGISPKLLKSNITPVFKKETLEPPQMEYES